MRRLIISVAIVALTPAVFAAPDALQSLVTKTKMQHMPLVHSLWENAGEKAESSVVMLDSTLRDVVKHFDRILAEESAQKWPQACENLNEMTTSARYASRLANEINNGKTTASFAEISKDTADLERLTIARRAATCKRAGIDPETFKSRFTKGQPAVAPRPTAQDFKDLDNLSKAAKAGKAAWAAGFEAGRAQDFTLACKEFTAASDNMNFVRDRAAILAESLTNRGLKSENVVAFGTEASRAAPMAAQRKAATCQRSVAK